MGEGVFFFLSLAGRMHLYITGKIGMGFMGVVVDGPEIRLKTGSSHYSTLIRITTPPHHPIHLSSLAVLPFGIFEPEKGQTITIPNSLHVRVFVLISHAITTPIPTIYVYIYMLQTGRVWVQVSAGSGCKLHGFSKQSLLDHDSG